MSNGEDVLDSWEEIDEAGLTNTLQKIQAERQKSSTTVPTTINATAVEQSTTIETSTNSTNCFNNDTNHLQPMKLLQRNSSENANGATTTVIKSTTTNAGSDESANIKSPLDDMSATFQPVLMVLHKPTDEYQSANYTQPMQTVKILRRPTQSSDRRNNDLRPKQPIKTLQQREQEYAEARLRILGSAKNPEDDVEQNPPEANALPYELQKPPPTAIDTKAPANVASNTTPTISRTNSTPKMQQHHQQQQSPGISLGVIGGSSGGGGVGGGGVVGVGNNMPPSPGNLKYHNHYYMQHQLLQQQANYYFQQQQQPPQQQHYQQQQQIGAAVAPVPSLPLPAPAYNNRSTMPVGAPLATAANNRNPHQTPAHLKYQQQQKLQQQQQLQQQYGQTWSSPTSTPTSNNAINASAPMTRTQQQESILRLPRGPDGSVGFQMRR